jgi:hypothetical protein
MSAVALLDVAGAEPLWHHILTRLPQLPLASDATPPCLQAEEEAAAAARDACRGVAGSTSALAGTLSSRPPPSPPVPGEVAMVASNVQHALQKEPALFPSLLQAASALESRLTALSSAYAAS